MKRGLWILLALAISTAVYFTIRFGLRPKPIPVMNATAFANGEEIGAVLYRHLYQDIRAEKVLLLGSDPELKENQDVWSGLLKTAVADGFKPDVIFTSDPNWQIPILAGVPMEKLELSTSELAPKLKQEVAAGHLVLVLAPSLSVSHLIPNSLARRLDQQSHHPVLALSTFNLSLTPEETSELQAQCVLANKPSDGLKMLDCAKSRVSALLAKKRQVPGKIWSIIERHGLKEYLVFVHR